MSRLVRYSRYLSRFKTPHFPRCQHSTLPFSTTTVDYNKPSRLDPPPIRVALTESAGRGVFATRKIGAGDLIHTAKPILAHPSFSTINTVCYFCLKKLTSTEFHGKGVAFCSQECKENAKVFYEVETNADWLAFDDYCRNKGLKYPLLVKRLACMVISGAASSESLDILQPSNLSHEMVSRDGRGLWFAEERVLLWQIFQTNRWLSSPRNGTTAYWHEFV
ncbi:hypothetical protein OIU77_030904 [Salix suchowensis]|uniref:SET domain-containing protein n=1 Tax=Salix suchowensis TaxID=1278906 RepID=A0ABQ9BDJ0_9ROSI|nr:hypothetical protein OIU77_030904 [Salix suchowensis]